MVKFRTEGLSPTTSVGDVLSDVYRLITGVERPEDPETKDRILFAAMPAKLVVDGRECSNEELSRLAVIALDLHGSRHSLDVLLTESQFYDTSWIPRKTDVSKLFHDFWR